VAGDEAADEFVNAINRGRDAFVAALDKGDAGGVDEAVKALEQSPALDKRSGELLEELKSLLVRAKEYAAMPAAGRAEQQRRAQARIDLASDFKAWIYKRDRWVRTEGDNLHGVYFPPPPRGK
jgi:hypothetical protein